MGNMYKNMLKLPSTDPIEENFLESFKHSYAKYKLTVNLYKVEKPTDKELLWKEFNELEKLPISSLTKKAFKCICL